MYMYTYKTTLRVIRRLWGVGGSAFRNAGPNSDLTSNSQSITSVSHRCNINLTSISHRYHIRLGSPEDSPPQPPTLKELVLACRVRTWHKKDCFTWIDNCDQRSRRFVVRTLS